jgi:uncharacterized membrane protein
MLTNNRIKGLVSLICCSLVTIKFLSFFYGSITFLFFICWSIPFIVFTYLANKLSIKAFQSFSFIVLIYFLSVSLRVFGIKPFILDLLEIIFIVILFILCILSPKSIKRNSY